MFMIYSGGSYVRVTKAVAFLIFLLSVLMISAPVAFSQQENIKILDYTWYTSPYGSVVAVGELQNVGTTTIDKLYISGTVFTTDGQPQASAPSLFYYEYLLPSQKVPFYIEFTPYSSVTGDLSWVSLGIENVTFEILPFNATSSWKYPDLKIVSSHQFIDENGTYAVTGIVQNTGSLSTGRVWVVATFYDTSGKVVAAGYTNFLTPNQLQPSQTTSFIVYPLDCTPELSQRIANYSLTIQTEGPIMPEIIYPSSCASPSTSPTVSNPPETPSIELSPSPQIETSQTFPAFYIAVIVIIAVILLAAAIMLRRR